MKITVLLCCENSHTSKSQCIIYSRKLSHCILAPYLTATSHHIPVITTGSWCYKTLTDSGNDKPHRLFRSLTLASLPLKSCEVINVVPLQTLLTPLPSGLLSQNGSSSPPHFSSHLSLLFHLMPLLCQNNWALESSKLCWQKLSKSFSCATAKKILSPTVIRFTIRFLHPLHLQSPLFLFPSYAHERHLCFRTWAFLKWILKLLAQNKWIKGIKMFKARTTSIGGSFIVSSGTKT